MSNVNLSIGGRTYTVACDPGQEEHVKKLGREIDGKLAGMTGLAGQSEPRTLLFAALLLADEIHEMRGSGGGQGHPRSADADPAAAEALEMMAERLERLAKRLEA